MIRIKFRDQQLFAGTDEPGLHAGLVWLSDVPSPVDAGDLWGIISIRDEEDVASGEPWGAVVQRNGSAIGTLTDISDGIGGWENTPKGYALFAIEVLRSGPDTPPTRYIGGHRIPTEGF